MSNYRMKAVSAAAATLLLAGGAWAQTSAVADPAVPGSPSTVGVTPQNAKEANQKAVPRADTATLVRTEPSAAARGSDMANDAKDAVTPNSSNNSTANRPATISTTPAVAPMTGNSGTPQTGTTANTGNADMRKSNNAATTNTPANRRATRPARADRN